MDANHADELSVAWDVGGPQYHFSSNLVPLFIKMTGRYRPSATIINCGLTADHEDRPLYPFLQGLAKPLAEQGFALLCRYKSSSLSLFPSVKPFTFLYTKPTKVTKKFVGQPLYPFIQPRI